MTDKNLNYILSLFKQMEVSDSFIKGTLFVLGGVLMRTNDVRTPAIVESSLQWLVPHDIDEVKDDILGRMYEHPIKSVIEELFFKVDLSIPVRDIELNELVLHSYEVSNHGLLPQIDISSGEMGAVTTIYHAALEKIGQALEKSDYSFEESYLAGICYFSMNSYIDQKAVGFIIHVLSDLAPPVIKYVFALPTMSNADPNTLPTQTALWGLITGLDDKFISIFWPFQSWVLFFEGNPIPDVEGLEPIDFMSHCYGVAAKFMWNNEPAIRSIAELSVGPSDIPPFTGSGEELNSVCDVIEKIWGYDPAKNDYSLIEKKQINACIIFSIFCSLCQSSKRDIWHENEIKIPSIDNDAILMPCPNIDSMMTFFKVSEKYLRFYPRLSLCAALHTSDGFRFLVMKEPLHPTETREIISDLIVGTRSKDIYICYFANLTDIFDQDLGQFQSIAFHVDQQSSAPYWFCRMVICEDAWLIRPFSKMDGADKNENVLLSNITSTFRPWSNNEIAVARSRLEKWNLKNNWNWSAWDS
jgi:hypothetical protein